MKNSDSQKPLSKQIIGSLLIVPAVISISLVFVGYQAISLADANALAKQERLATHSLASEIERLTLEQQSATIWDDAVLETRRQNFQWMDENLGSWMQAYFDHSENYVLDQNNKPIMASADGRRLAPEAYDRRLGDIGPLVAQLRMLMSVASERQTDRHKVLSTLSVTAQLSLAGKPSIVSIVPIITETGLPFQEPGSEAVHVAVRYIDAELSRRIGEPIELADVRFSQLEPERDTAGIALFNPAGNPVAWLVWKPDQPGLSILSRILPVLLASGLALAVLVGHIIRRLLRTSGQLQVSEAQARFLSNHDALTGLPNRSLLKERLSQALQTSNHTEGFTAILAIDLDGFKSVNDSLGHPAGDELIRQVGGRLSELVRTSDTVARFGGDEFMVLLRDVQDQDALERLCGRIVSELSAPYALLGRFGSVGASIGAVMAPSSLDDPDSLIQRADMALYQAKAQGKGRYALFEEALTSSTKYRTELEADLRSALEAETGLRLVYQPFYDGEGRVTGAEALCRWDHPVHGALSPEIFIHVAEERGVIDELGAWVLGKACRFASDLDLDTIAVNVSPLQLRNPAFVEMVVATLAQSELEPTRLELELTEKAVLEQSREVADALIQLRSIGIKISLDDFATGNSSLQYIRDHRVDCLKIDRTFVARLGKDEESDHLVHVIFALARAIGISVTVEGVETEAQRSLLAAMGCKTFQGYLMSGPIEPEHLHDLLRSGAKHFASSSAGSSRL